MRTSLFAAATAVLVCALGVPVSATASATATATATPVPTCKGKPATIVSSSAVITGTARSDVIVVRGSGNHRVYAGAGNDIVCGSSGNDVIFAGAGNDRVFGGRGNDTLQGAAGNDVLAGGLGVDRLMGGIGVNMCAPGDPASVDCVIDTAAPAISAFQTPTQVSAGELITFTWRVSDPSGVTASDVRVGGYQGWAGWCFAKAAVVTSGNDRDGVWSTTCQVPDNVINDTFEVQVFAVDALGNAAMEPTIASFTTVGGSNDRSAPIVSDVTFPATVQRGQTLSVSLRAQDESGLGFASVIVRSSQPAFVWGTRYTLISGDTRDGVYQVEVDIPPDAGAGDYDVWLWVGDSVNNRLVVTDLGTVSITA